MKHFAKFMLLTLCLVVVVAVVVSFLPRHASAGASYPNASITTNVTLVAFNTYPSTPACSGGFQLLSPSTTVSCYTGPPAGKWLVVTGIRYRVQGTAGDDFQLTLDEGYAYQTTAVLSSVGGYASGHDNLTTGIVFDHTPVLIPTVFEGGSLTSYYIELDGYVIPN